MSKKLKLSPWHDGSVKPVHVGLYKVISDYEPLTWSFFDGVIFNGCWDSEEEAFNNKDWGKGVCVIKWRGVLK